MVSPETDRDASRGPPAAESDDDTARTPGGVERTGAVAGSPRDGLRPTALLDRVVEVAERRATPRRALGALLAVVVVTTSALTVIAISPGTGQTAPQWETTELGVLPPLPEPPPLHQPLRPVGMAPGASPPPGVPVQPSGEFVGWAVLDRTTGAVQGSSNMTEVSTTASMIKVWIVADYLRRTTEAGQAPSRARLDQLELIIRDSDNALAEALYRELGADESIQRLISLCRLTDSRPYRNFWSNTQLSPRDTARMGACIADGGAAGPEWTDWLLGEMRAVRGVGDFGIRHALPESERDGIAIKNGWIDRTYDGNWHVNCLAIGDTWAMGVMTRYPVHLGYEHGAEICRSLAAEHLP